MIEYLVIFEKAGDNYSAYVPDLPGCITTGKTQEETERNIEEAIDLYIDTLRATGQPIPKPTVSRPPKGTGAALLELAGAWSHMTDEEIEHIKREILSSRRSSPPIDWEPGE